MSVKTKTKLVWLRRDLRVHDNPALYYACQQQGAVRAVFIVCPQQWQAHGLGARHINLLLQALQSLSETLRTYQIQLDLINSTTFKQAALDLQHYIKEHAIDELLFNIEYELNERKRDKQMLNWAQQAGVTVHRFHDQCLLEPGYIRTAEQSYFKVFSAFKKRYIAALNTQLTPPLPAPKVQKNYLDTPIARIKLDVQDDPNWSVSEAAAHQTLQDFLQHKVMDYHALRDIPAADGSSRLSTYLALGLLSTRQCVFSAYQMNDHRLTAGYVGLDTWINELIWRDFYRHLMFGFPYVCQNKPFKEERAKMNWLDNPAHFDAWCSGQTGYPLIDAAMAQLQQSGWMHNRLRMLCAMFLSKHLLLDWRKGEAFFSRSLVDIDFASNNGGWQWSASTGADAVPYFRIFNPIIQSQKFDVRGDFIRQYVPQLASLNAKDIHFPSISQRQALNYPVPIVEHKAARLRALEAFKQKS